MGKGGEKSAKGTGEGWSLSWCSDKTFYRISSYTYVL